jgi:hypothetical protein
MKLPAVVKKIKEIQELRLRLDSLFEKESSMCPHVSFRESSLFEGQTEKVCNREDNISIGTHYTTFCKPEFCPMQVENLVGMEK